MSILSGLSGSVGATVAGSVLTSAMSKRHGGSHGDGSGRAAALSGFTGGTFMSSVVQSLRQVISADSVKSGAVAVSPRSATSPAHSRSPGTSPDLALNAFTQALFSSLYGANNPASTNPAGQSGAGQGAASTGYLSAPGSLESRLGGLIQTLSTANSSPMSALSAPGGQTGATSASSYATLQQEFHNLLSAFGATQGQTTLSGFLASLSTNLQNNGASLGLNAIA
ncbi:hypothetical protein [Ferrovum sp.]|uniref:hypothetical protein n=1 Tax=Ferrovum sp. TaxID=2609467 RepID=UPI002638633E|nr:hypothetical protein [Ferrovum sp.]